MSRVIVQVIVTPAEERTTVRVWVDNIDRLDLGSEIEIPVARDGERWQGKIDPALIERWTRLCLRILIGGRPGIRWHVTVTQLGRHPQILMSDGDVLAVEREWFIGTCELR